MRVKIAIRFWKRWVFAQHSAYFAPCRARSNCFLPLPIQTNLKPIPFLPILEKQSINIQIMVAYISSFLGSLCAMMTTCHCMGNLGTRLVVITVNMITVMYRPLFNRSYNVRHSQAGYSEEHKFKRQCSDTALSR